MVLQCVIHFEMFVEAMYPRSSYNARVTCCISKPNYQRTKEQRIKFTQAEIAKSGCKVIMPRFPEHTHASKQH